MHISRVSVNETNCALCHSQEEVLGNHSAKDPYFLCTCSIKIFSSNFGVFAVAISGARDLTNSQSGANVCRHWPIIKYESR